MKKAYISPEMDYIRFSLESIMGDNDMNFSDPHIPIDDGGTGERD